MTYEFLIPHSTNHAITAN